jgi:pyrimidine-nucleoside phosphorylase
MAGVAAPETAAPSAHILAAVAQKRAGEALAGHAIDRLVRNFVAGSTPDYQMAAWLATVACKGMDLEETVALTRAYLAGGKRLRLQDIGRTVLDKHSTGGVGDKVSLVVVPVVAACGLSVAKMSGRGLGYAGGTIDKLESIGGLRLELPAEEFCSVLRKTGMVIASQSVELVPGDLATYALRDVTGTVESIPLIAASIVSKKVAVGADGLVLDVKCGAGAFISDRAMATELATTMIAVARSFGLGCRAILSDMDQPLGYAVGNALEVKEALAVLRGTTIPGLSELCNVVARVMLQTADPDLGDGAADEMVRRALASGAAYELFIRWAEAQGADVRQLHEPRLLPTAAQATVVTSDGGGWIETVNPRAIGAAALRVGAGRLVKGAAIDHAAGILLHARVGDRVERGDVLAEIQYDGCDCADAVELARSAFAIAEAPPAERAVVHRIF